MSILSLPSELLFEVIESPLLANRDIKNLRLVHQVFRDHVQRRLFSHLRIHFQLTHGNRRNPLAMSQRLLRFVNSSEKHLPRYIRTLTIVVEGDKGDGFTTFVSTSANRFFQHFRRIEHLKMDFRPAFRKQRNDYGNVAALMRILSRHRLQEKGRRLEIARFSLIANWKWLQDVSEMATAGITDLRVLTHEVGSRFYYAGDETRARFEGLLKLSRQSIAGAIERYGMLRNLDLSTIDRLITLDSVFAYLDGSRLTSLTLTDKQLPATDETVMKLKTLESLTITDVDKGYNSRDPARVQTQIWRRFERAGIKLRKLIVPALSETLLGYLANNPSLASFTILCDNAIINGIAFNRKFLGGCLANPSSARTAMVTDYRRVFFAMSSQLRYQVMPILSHTLQKLALKMSFKYHDQVAAKSRYELKDSYSNIVNGCFAQSTEDNPNGLKMTEGSLLGMDNLMSLICGFSQLELLEFAPVRRNHQNDPEVIESAIGEWGYRQPDEKNLWRDGMILVIPWKRNDIRKDVEVYILGKSEFVLRKSTDGLWKFRTF